jgi:hypothetical protein
MAKSKEEAQRVAVKALEAATQAFVTRQYKLGGVEGKAEGEEEVIAVHRFVTEPARVQMDLGLTLNLGNYESARVAVSVTIPCYKEEMEAAYAFGSAWVKDRIQKEVDEVRNHKQDCVF